MKLSIVELIKEGLEKKSGDKSIDFQPVKLSYGFNDLEEFVDGETMDTHYNKHYKGYVKKLNELLDEKKVQIKSKDLLTLVKRINGLGKKIKNQAGGAYNHELFWNMITPDKSKRKFEGEIKRLIESQFGSFDKFKEEFTVQSKSKFGSGWCWLLLKPNKKLKIITTSNQDNPLMNIYMFRDKYNEESPMYKSMSGKILLGLDLWEHAYYLKYRNKREDYINNFWKVVNWDFVNSIIKKQEPKK